MDRRRFTRREVSGSLLAAATLLARRNPAGTPAPDAMQTLDITSSTDARFDDTRRALIWNQRVSLERAPAAIVHVRSEQDVVAAVRYAKTRALRIAVRSGGHNYHGTALRDGGMLLDLSKLDGISLDVPQRRASFGPALRSGRITTALAPSGLAFPVGHCSDVGLGGYLLNGGFGLNLGEWGPACMSVTGMQMVMADGRLIHASEHENRDLFWAARGAGAGFFAVVTRFDVQLHPRPQALHVFNATFDIGSATSVARWLARMIPQVHAGIEIAVLLGPLEKSGPPVISIAAIGVGPSDAQASAQVAALRAIPADVKLTGPPQELATSYAEAFAMVDASFPNDTRMAGDQVWTDAPIVDVMHAVSHFVADMPPAPSNITLLYLGGGGRAPRMPSPDEAALSVGGGAFVGAYAFWGNPSGDRQGQAWVRDVILAAEPYRAGRYIGEADLAVSAARVRECFSPAAWERLARLKRRHDPDNRFFSYLT